MELEICAAMFVVSAVVVFLVSVLGTRQKSYEEAIEEARKRSQERESALQQAKAAQKREGGGKKVKGRWGRSRLKDTEGGEPPSPTPATAAAVAPPSPVVDHVEFQEEAEVVLIPQEDEDLPIVMPTAAPTTSAVRQRRPAKPILVHKEAPPQELPAEAPPPPVRRNSFKDILPKDEIELKHLQQEHEASSAAEGPRRAKTPPKSSPLREKPRRKARPQGDTADAVAEGGSGTSSADLSAGELLKLVRCSTRLTDEAEVEQLVEELLNRTGGGGAGQWHKRGHDPEAQLRKMLADREKDLEAERQHSLSHATKVKELRQELNQQLSRTQQQERNLKAQQKLVEENQAAAQRSKEEARQLQARVHQLETELREATGCVRESLERREAELERVHAEALAAERAESAQALSQAQARLATAEASCQELRQRLEQEAQAQAATRQASEGKVQELSKVHQAELEAERVEHQRRMAALEQRCQEQVKTAEELRGRLAEAAASHAREVGELRRHQAEVEAQLEESQRVASGEQERALEALKAELDAQRAKNNDLRTKNWEVVEAMQAAERKQQQQQQQHSQQMQSLRDELSKEHEKKERELLRRLLPQVKVDDSEGLEHTQWLKRFEEALSKVTAQGDSSQDKARLEKEVEHYQRVLSETEEMLQSLQRSVEQEERGWREQEQAHALERSTWEHRERELSARCQALEGDLQQLQGLQQTTSEMQAKLKELQEKLQDEESEKRMLEQKYDEASRNAQDVKSHLEGRVQVLEEMKKGQDDYHLLQKEVRELRAQLEEERAAAGERLAALDTTPPHNGATKVGSEAPLATNGPAPDLVASPADKEDKLRLKFWKKSKK